MKNLKLFLCIIAAVFFFTNCGQKDYDRIYEIGITGVGLVSKVEDTNVTINDNPKVRLYVTVYTLNMEPFEAVVTSVVSKVAIPRAGDVLAVKFDPEDKQKIIWMENEDITPEIRADIDSIEAMNQ